LQHPIIQVVAECLVIESPPRLDNGRSPHEYINQRLQIQFGAPDDERYAAQKNVEPPINFGIINSITRLHLFGCFYWFRLPRVMKHYFPTGRRNHGRPSNRLLDT